ncbi:hypothetical protein BJY01DRAFT_250856 [Aspergillus pseudoustus]|uniref:Uncharacterized protein n=1 Tax=Aspergillus pseudoustus TaxID=1810923 RepID=A0ABR4JHP4_9EURO
MSTPLPTNSTTEFPLFPYLLGEVATAAAGSILSVDPSRDVTTIMLSCVNDNPDCARLGLPIALTTGPTTHQCTTTRRLLTGVRPGAWFTRTDSIECHVSSMTADCSGGLGWTLPGETRVTEDPFSFTQKDYLNVDAVLTVTGGLDLLTAPVPVDSSTTTLTSTDSPTRFATVTTATSVPALPSETDMREAPASQESSSKAWIAGPVIGAVVGFCLIVVSAWWVWRRRHKSVVASNHHPGGKQRAEPEAPTNKPGVPEMAATEAVPASELPAGSRANNTI